MTLVSCICVHTPMVVSALALHNLSSLILVLLWHLTIIFSKSLRVFVYPQSSNQLTFNFFASHLFRVRFHYGHPDVFDRVFHITRGGISKASKTINLSEDVFAGTIYFCHFN